MTLDASFGPLLEDLKQEIRQARVRAHISVNKELIHLYWRLGRKIRERQEKQKWGSKVIESVSKELRKEFPEMKGLSSVNLKRMRLLASEYSADEIGSQAVTQLPWGHVQELMFKVKDKEARDWYAEKTVENGWSRNVLTLQIKTDLYSRTGKSITNFKSTLPALQSDLAQQIVKDPYNLEFLDVQEPLLERHLETKLVQNIRDFLLELGSGFAFIGNQYHLTLEEEDYFLDLLFYHVKLKCYVVIELKTGKFKPEYAGKMNFYLNLVDRQLKDEKDNPSIGLILCEQKKGITAEYAIEGIQKPMGVSAFTLTKNLPKDLAEFLPDPEEISKSLKVEK